MATFSHEDPMLLVLPERTRAWEALPVILAHPQVRHHQLPAMWCLERAGIDLVTALPDCPAITRESLGRVLEVLLQLCSKEALDALVQRTWREVDERVRHYYLKRSVAKTLAGIFKLTRPTLACEPPADFVRDRIHESSFEVQYRLPPPAEAQDFRAPAHEGSLVLYPFDPANAEARDEAGLGPGDGTVLECFAYEAGRRLHHDFLQALASEHGWQVVEPRA